MTRRISLVLAFLLLSLAGCAGQPDPLKTELMYCHNRERVKQNKSVLHLDPALETSAQKWADWMAQHSKLVHSQMAIGETPYQIMGENIAMGYRDTDSVVHDWMQSPGHRRNILNSKFSHAGFGFAKSPDGTPYWCAQFGGP